MASRKVLELALLNAKNDPSVENISMYFRVARSYWDGLENLTDADREARVYILDYIDAQLQRIMRGQKAIPCDICMMHPHERVNGRHRYIICERYPGGLNRELLERTPCRYSSSSIDLKEAEICNTL
jgi:hypothetical protein